VGKKIWKEFLIANLITLFSRPTDLLAYLDCMNFFAIKDCI